LSQHTTVNNQLCTCCVFRFFTCEIPNRICNIFKICNILNRSIICEIIFAIVPIIVLFFLSLGVGMILCTLDVFFKDVENLYDVFTLLLFYITPIVYTVDKLGFEPGSWQETVLKINPMYGIIDMFRAAVLHSTEFAAYFDINSLWYTMGFAAVMLIIGFALFYKCQDRFILHISRVRSVTHETICY